MRHTSTRELFAYWDARRGERPAPERADIDPVKIRHILGDVFILTIDFASEHRFRLAGTQMCALFGRELKAEAFAALWDEASRPVAQYLLKVLAEEKIGGVAGVVGHTGDGDSVDLELLMLPLISQDGIAVQVLGLLVPSEKPYWFGDRPVATLELGQIRHIGPAVDQLGGRRLVTGGAAVQVRRGLMVYQGGRSSAPSDSPSGSNSEKAG
ncbi:MAG: PAS domain-containing protein [Pseudolabrys sp.]